jgi:4a-hydroxytetrahydrobiopterin dehydratase
MRSSKVATTAVELKAKHCVECEGDAEPLDADKVQSLLTSVPEWELSDDRKRIRRIWRAKDFSAALGFFQQIGRIAETEDHHPDLHLTDFRNVRIDLSTHAVGGLTENDFIMAAKIDALPIELKTQ